MSEQKTLNGAIALDRLIHVVMEKKGKNGMVKGLFIPIEQNLLEVDDYGIHIPLRIIYKPEQDNNNQNGFICKTIGSKTYKAASEEQKALWKDYGNEDTKSQTKILGSIKDWSSVSASANSGSASKEVLTEDDDLPF